METQSQIPAAQARPGLRKAAFGGLLLLLAAGFFLDLATGSVDIPLDQVLSYLLGRGAENAGNADILHLFRLPRAVTALLAGSALSAAGLMMQTLFRNPLADPFILGISAGAGLGVALVVMAAGLFGGAAWEIGTGIFGGMSMAFGAAVGAAAVFLLVLFVSGRVKNTMTILILGLLFGYVASALVSVLMHFSLRHGLQAYIRWTFGSFGGVTWDQMRVFAPVTLLALAAGVPCVKALNALLLGEDYARTMGQNVGLARTGIILTASVLAGGVTAFCGPIGFVGVAVPHLARGLFGTADHRVIYPVVILLGGAVTLFADLFAQLPGSGSVLPVNAVTALIGAPVVIFVLFTRTRSMEAFS